jgi:transcriptional regulator with XRE-family HTH domain
VPTDDITRSELGLFLKARRAELTPGDVGLPDPGGLRRVAGLRREEVADLASISTDYYTRLEQGRVAASRSVLAALAGALRLGEDQRSYLASLSGKGADVAPGRRAQAVLPALARMLDQLTDSPALVLGRDLDLLAWNPLAVALMTDFGAVPEAERNYVWLIFTHPEVRGALADWDEIAEVTVAFLRHQATGHLEDPGLIELVESLSDADPDFARWWDSHHVVNATTGTKSFHHDVVGRVTLEWEMLASATDADQRLLVMTAEPGSPSWDALHALRVRGNVRS